MLKIFIQSHSLSAGKGGTERVAMELADEMARRNHEIFMGYKNNGPPSYSNKNKIHFSPYHSFKELRNIVQSIDPDVFFSFYVNHVLIKNYSVVYGTQIPFAIQECSNKIRICIKGKMGERNSCISSYSNKADYANLFVIISRLY
jgi:hypothetical protein